MSDEDSFIYTDSFKTKDLLWDNFDGYTRSFNDYMSLKYINREDQIINMRLYKYNMAFYDMIKVYFDDFEEQLGKEKIKHMIELSKKDDLNTNDFRYIRDFFGTFMYLTGISRVSMKKEDPGKSVEHGFH